MDRSRDLTKGPMTPFVSTTNAALHGAAHISPRQRHLFTKLRAQTLCIRHREPDPRGRPRSWFKTLGLNVTLLAVIRNYFKSDPHGEGATL